MCFICQLYAYNPWSFGVLDLEKGRGKRKMSFVSLLTGSQGSALLRSVRDSNGAECMRAHRRFCRWPSAQISDPGNGVPCDLSWALSAPASGSRPHSTEGTSASARNKQKSEVIWKPFGWCLISGRGFPEAPWRDLGAQMSLSGSEKWISHSKCGERFKYFLKRLFT